MYDYIIPYIYIYTIPLKLHTLQLDEWKGKQQIAANSSSKANKTHPALYQYYYSLSNQTTPTPSLI